MNCHYCQQEVRQISKGTITNTVFTTLMCETCHVVYDCVATDAEEPVLTTVTIFAITIKDRDFEIKYHQIPQQTEVCSYTKQPPPSVEAYDKHELHTFNFIANWTPFNAKEKLQRLLAFM